MLRCLLTASLFVLSKGVLTLTDDDVAVVKAGAICAGGPKRKNMGPVMLVGMAGDKACTTWATMSAEYIEMHTQAAMLINSTDASGTQYMSNANLKTDFVKSGDGYFKAPTKVPATPASSTSPQYVFFSFGTDVGDTTSTAYGYVGMAAYAMIQGELSFQENTFMVRDNESEICAIPIESTTPDTACGAARKVTPGTIKYSLFGYGAGSAINTTFANNSFLGLRSKIVYTKMGTNTSVTFNNNVKASDIGTTQIESFTFKGASTTLSLAFPQWFNYGITENSTQKKKGSAQVKIRHVASSTAGEFYIDYLFSKHSDGIGADKGWFVYDPTFSAGDPPTTTAAAGDDGDGDDVIGGAKSQVMSMLMFLPAILWMQA